MQGEHHNLKEIYDSVNAFYFENKLDIPIVWFGKRNTVPRSQIRFGSYNLKTSVVRINRVLDQPHVPGYFIAYIVYHEMLHHILPPIKIGRRRSIHHQEFKKREKEFEHYALAKEFIAAFAKNFLRPRVRRPRYLRKIINLLSLLR